MGIRQSRWLRAALTALLFEQHAALNLRGALLTCSALGQVGRPSPKPQTPWPLNFRSLSETTKLYPKCVFCLGFFFVATAFNYCCSSRDEARRIAANAAFDLMQAVGAMRSAIR
jgi:hypothetical protein